MTKNQKLVCASGMAVWTFALAWAGPTQADSQKQEEATKMPDVPKLDLYKKHKADYLAKQEPGLVEVGPATYLAITGRGEPGGTEFVKKVGALYAMAFTVKMQSKAAGRDYTVCKLEGLWWGTNQQHDFQDQPRESWNWTLLIRTPVFITQDSLTAAQEQLIKKGKSANVAEVELTQLEEGRCVQVLHLGPYSTESKTIAAMTEFAKDQGLARNGLHHEIYLSDPNKTEPAKMRTILRQPVR